MEADKRLKVESWAKDEALDLFQMNLGEDTLWSCTSHHAAYITDLQENIGSLRTKLGELTGLAQKVRRSVDYAVLHQMEPKRSVQFWLDGVEIMEDEVKQVLEEGDREIQNNCHGYCQPMNCWSSYRTGKKVCRKLQDVAELTQKGEFAEVAHRSVENGVVGFDSMLDKIWSWIEDKEVGIIGLYGIGGVGKTTLLKMINHGLLKTMLEFELVIWVVVSKQANIENIQDVILNKLDVPWANRNGDVKRQLILDYLKKKKFLLLLDNIWENLGLAEVGVPRPNGVNSKLIFTTRSENVCYLMKAQRHLRVECLALDKAVTLFRMNVGDDIFDEHPDIPELAKEIVEMCKGLPLAIITIGRAMADKTSPEKWDRAVEQLKAYPSTFSGMKDQVFPVLKFSYDSLRDETIKSCFLYCSLFASDYEISEDELILLWIGEGLLFKSQNIHQARHQGSDIIESLKFACLLESSESEKHVKMHDMIRDMALWLTCTDEENRKKIVVKERSRMIESSDFEEWKEAEMISLWDVCSLSMFDPHTEEPRLPSFPNLGTFLLRRSSIYIFPFEFLQKLHSIRILDLSHNYCLESCLGISQLVNLEYLDISFTRINELDMIRGLQNLKYLILNFTHLKRIPPGLISSLSSLQLFSLHGGSLPSDQISLFAEIYQDNVLSGGRMSLLEELERLKCINEISIILHRDISVKTLLSSCKLQRCIRNLHLQSCGYMTSLELSSSSLERMLHLEMLQISSCNNLTCVEIYVEDQGNQEHISRDSMVLSKFSKLHEVQIISCKRLLNLTWLIYAPYLQVLVVSKCPSMEAVSGYDDNIVGRAKIEQRSGYFSRLTTLQLEDLPILRSICGQVLPLPSLKTMYVHSCERLTKLPFDSNTGKNKLRKIQAQQSWWEGLQWENDEIKQSFGQYFVPSEYLNLYQILGYDH